MTLSHDLLYSRTVTLPQLCLTNPNTSAMQDVWLYVKGNVSNILFTEEGGGCFTVSGTGFEGRWFNVSSLMAAGTSKCYSETFDYNPGGNCAGDTVMFYSASGFDSPWSPATGSEMVFSDWEHVAAKKRLRLLPAEARITGSINVSNTTMTYNQQYTVTATVSSEASPGALVNPNIILTVPAGRVFKMVLILLIIMRGLQ